MGYRKILVAVDGSKNSFKALQHAIDLAKCCNAEIGVLCVVVPSTSIPLYSHLDISFIPEISVSEIEEFGKTVLNQAMQLIPSEVKAQSYLKIDSPAEVIPEFAKENNFELIVIGTRGMGMITGLIMGSVSTHVVTHAKCPVLVVK